MLEIFLLPVGHFGKLESFVLRVWVTPQEGAGCLPINAYCVPPATLGGLQLLLQALHLPEPPNLEYSGLQTPGPDVRLQ